MAQMRKVRRILVPQPWWRLNMYKNQNAVRSYLRWVWSLIQRFFSAPFQDLPPAFGDTVPPEMRAYEAQVEDIQHQAVGMVSSRKSRGHRKSKPHH